MAIKKEQLKEAQDDSKLLSELINHYNESEKYIAQIRDNADFTWDDRENMLVGVLTDIGSKTTKSKVNTQDLVNLILDGASRVMAQFPTGTIQAINTEDDKGKNILMNLVHEKYIVPNADSQFDFLTKLRIWDIYSRVFGSMPALVDYRVDDDYIGPDMWLIHPRNFFPQAGCTNINSMDYAQVSTWVSVEYLKGRDKKVWKNLPELIRKVKEGGKTKQQMEQKHLPVNERLNSVFASETGEFAQCELLTEYRKNRWITYSKEYNLVARDMPNPQDNNELPIVMKHCFPLIDRLYALAEFERGHTLQKAANSLVNLYFEGVQMSIFPPLILDQNGIVASTIEYKAKAKWIRTKAGAIEQMKLSPEGLNTFNSTYGFLKSQMLNLGATTDTTVSKDTDPGQGKTPQALKMQGAREGARDNWDRFMMEQALEQVNQKFIDLLSTKQEKPIDITLFKSDLKKLQEAYPDEDLSTVFGLKAYTSGNAGKLTVASDTWKDGKSNIKFKYIIDSGSTMKKDDEEEHDALVEIMALILKFPDALPQITQKGTFTLGDKTFNFGEAIKRYIITSGVQDSEKIISDNKDQQGQPGAQDQNAQSQAQVQQLTQQVQQLMQGMQQMQAEIAKKPEKKVEDSISYKDVPDDVKRQIEAKAGLTPSSEFSVGEGEDPVHKAMNLIRGSRAVEEPVPTLNQEAPKPDFASMLGGAPNNSPAPAGQ